MTKMVWSQGGHIKRRLLYLLTMVCYLFRVPCDGAIVTSAFGLKQHVMAKE